jgi:two-component system, chemotaxis family, sensor kinase CheA
MERDEEFQRHLLATFKLEADEHLSGIVSGLIELEKGGSPERMAELVETVFREAHSLKGAARSVGRSDIEALCQALEALFSAMKRGEAKPAPELFDLMQKGADFLGRSLAGEQGEEEKLSQREIVRRLTAAAKGEGGSSGVAAAPAAPARHLDAPLEPAQGAPRPEQAAAPAVAQGVAAAPRTEHRAGEGGLHPAGTKPGDAQPESRPSHPEPAETGELPGKPAPAAAETVRVAWSKLSAVLLLSEEMLSAKLSTRQHALQMRELRVAHAEWKKQWSRILPALQRLAPLAAKVPGSGQEGGGEHGRELYKILEFLEWNAGFVKMLEAKQGAQAKRAEHDSRSLGGMVDNLLADMKKAMMFPFSSLLEPFPKIVRDLARDSGKEADLVIHGEEIEIDRRILEEMKDPLIHLVRNAVDHGIERPEQRLAKNKPRRGAISIVIAPRDDKAEIVVSDDGGGIIPSEVRGALTKLGGMTADKAQSLADAELLPLIFQSGVSTSPIITEVSGHGLGLAIVREKVEKLGGTVTVESAPERGTLFRIVLPLSVATFRGVLVRVADRIFVLPATHVDRALRLKRGEIGTVQNKEAINLDGSALALETLASILRLPAREPLPEQLQAVVISQARQRVALVVDEVVGEQEVLLKSLGPQLLRVRNIAGATVLGSGKVAPILNVADLVKSASGAGGGTHRAPAAVPPPAATGQNVLVVDDSITSRTLLKNILESAGYHVATAVDGVDAFTRLKSEAFDVVVSDVDMPRMNGFELTGRIRSDQELRELPVVLVTALASREDRERGIDVGASAYIVKSSFDQSNLLEVVKRLC